MGVSPNSSPAFSFYKSIFCAIPRRELAWGHVERNEALDVPLVPAGIDMVDAVEFLHSLVDLEKPDFSISVHLAGPFAIP